MQNELRIEITVWIIQIESQMYLDKAKSISPSLNFIWVTIPITQFTWIAEPSLGLKVTNLSIFFLVSNHPPAVICMRITSLLTPHFLAFYHLCSNLETKEKDTGHRILKGPAFCLSHDRPKLEWLINANGTEFILLLQGWSRANCAAQEADCCPTAPMKTCPLQNNPVFPSKLRVNWWPFFSKKHLLKPGLQLRNEEVPSSRHFRHPQADQSCVGDGAFPVLLELHGISSHLLHF